MTDSTAKTRAAEMRTTASDLLDQAEALMDAADQLDPDGAA